MTQGFPQLLSKYEVTRMQIKRIAYFIFSRMTLLDFVGIYDVLRRVALLGIDGEVKHRVIGSESPVVDEGGLGLIPDGVYESLASFDLLIVPGGMGTRELMGDERCMAFLRSWGDQRPVASVCTGSLLLGKCGFLNGRRATTHHLALDTLAPFCAETVSDARVVDTGNVITAGGVSAGIDLGLHLVTRFWGGEARNMIASRMEYASPPCAAPWLQRVIVS
jgi:cyclohexyl-isocyanide hydratase